MAIDYAAKIPNNVDLEGCIAEYFEQIGLFLPFICTPEELLGEANAE